MNGLRTLILLVLAGAAPALADVISVQPSALNVAAGASFSVELRISGATDLSAYNLDLGFDPSVLMAISVTEGPLPPGFPATIFLPGTINNTTGTISYIADALYSGGITGSGTLATIQFTALGQGVSPLTVFNVVALNSAGEDIAVETTPGSVSVSAVPEPGSWILLLSAAGGFAIVRKRANR